jgi:hypothetical protein
VFHNAHFIKLLTLCLQTLFEYGRLKKDTHILLYTSTEFKEKIEQLNIFKKNSSVIFFHINDEYNSVDAACKSRLDLFEFPMVKDYYKILYLDTDILVMKNINIVFNSIQENKLYAMEEGSIDWYTDYWGYTLFGDEVNKYDDKSAFSSGVMGFLNCPEIETLFQKIKLHIKQDNRWFECYDQPYIVYNAKTSGLLDNKTFNTFVVGNSPYGDAKEHDILSNKTIFHFCGSPGASNHKLNNMKQFLEKHNNHIRNINSPHLFHQIQSDLKDFVQQSNCTNKTEILELQSNKGFVTEYLSEIFDKVYAVDKQEYHKYNQDFNNEKTNIKYHPLSIYRETWEIIQNDAISILFIHFMNSKTCFIYSIMNAIQMFKNLQYIVLNGYSNTEYHSVINQCISNRFFILEKHIGNKVESKNGEYSEAVILSMHPLFKTIQDRSYWWKDDGVNINGNIKFRKDFLENSFSSNGRYKVISTRIVRADFSNEEHILFFNSEYTQFRSIRRRDYHISNGEIKY